MALMAEAEKLPASNATPRRITILGSTGSIGCSTLDLVERQPESFEIEALTAHRNVDALVAQALKFRPSVAVIGDPAGYDALKQGLAGSGIEAAAGAAAIDEAASRPSDFVMAGIVGAAGLAPTLAAVRRGACVALANKECLVSAGALFLAEVERSGAVLLPVDSEHNAIFQVLEADKPESISRIILTASGGPFRTWTVEEMATATPAQAVAHPRWEMGAKISVDSATLMNKGLELIEAFYLFPVEESQIDVIIHPESIIHSMVEYVDGSVLAQLGSPDMRTPIGYTLAWPSRMATPSARLDFAEIGKLTFEVPDVVRFPLLRLAREALKDGGAAPNVLNAANEVAVAAFLNGRLPFAEIAATVEEVLRSDAWGTQVPSGLEDVYELDALSRKLASEWVQKRSC
ncbi:1-deoxy-D-xylulose-5-phosphate reductoisomerase [Parvibaculum sp. MBR-TMA-1.3b-4.2]